MFGVVGRIGRGGCASTCALVNMREMQEGVCFEMEMEYHQTQDADCR